MTLARPAAFWRLLGAFATLHVAFVAFTGGAYQMGEVGRLGPGAVFAARRPGPDGPVTLRGPCQWQ